MVSTELEGSLAKLGPNPIMVPWGVLISCLLLSCLRCLLEGPKTFTKAPALESAFGVVGADPAF